MRFFRGIAGILGFVRDEGDHDVKQDHEEEEEEGDEAEQYIPQSRSTSGFHQTGLPRRKGFSVPVQVPVDRQHPGPVLLPCNSGDGGVQGLKWYAKRLKVDEDGDVADEFLNETPSSNSGEQRMSLPRFETNLSVRHAKVKRQVMSQDGKFKHLIEYQGQRRLV
ncbi:hypothetical protein LINGRAHAP2_LOCUS25159 [Linum grandiflorum]